MKKAFKKFYDIFTMVEKVALTALFLFLTFAIVFDVFRRKLVGVSLPWIEELGRYTLVYCTMICASMGITSDGHARMDAVVGLLKGKVLKAVRILSNLLPSAACFYLAYWAYVHVQKMAQVGTMTTSLGIPLWLCYLVMPLGMMGIAIRSLVLVGTDIRNFNKEDAVKPTELDSIQELSESVDGEGENT